MSLNLTLHDGRDISSSRLQLSEEFATMVLMQDAMHHSKRDAEPIQVPPASLTLTLTLTLIHSGAPSETGDAPTASCGIPD